MVFIVQTYRLQPVRGFPELGSESTIKYHFKYRQPLNGGFADEIAQVPVSLSFGQ